MKRMLMLASVASMIDQFNMANIELLQQMGFEVNVACNFYEGNTCSEKKVYELQEKLKQMNVLYFQIDFARNISKVSRNIKALKQVLYLIKKNQYDFVHCHSPIGGVVGRIAGKMSRTKVIYTAHGFHFYKGAPIRNWIIYYPIEWFLSWLTDVLITINDEDYVRAKKSMHAKRLEYVPGIGVDSKKFNLMLGVREEKRRELGIEPNAVILLSVEEMSKCSNQRVIIEALAKVKKSTKVPFIYYICNQDEHKYEYLELINKLNLSDTVKLLGLRTDISELCATSDIYVLPFLQYAIPISLIEAMASGLPVIASRERGRDEFIVDDKGGYLIDDKNVDGFAKKIMHLIEDKNAREEMAAENVTKIKRFDVSSIKFDSDNISIYQWNSEKYFSDYRLTYLEKIIINQRIRRELKIPYYATLLLSVGELNENKNHSSIIKVLGDMKRVNKLDNIYYIICGQGKLKDNLEQLIKDNGLDDRVKLLGFRSDVSDIYKAADIFVFPSLREGLSVALMEAMSNGLPCVVSRIRGNVDLIEDNQSVYITLDDEIANTAKIIKFLNDDKIKKYTTGKCNLQRIKLFDITVVNRKLEAIYSLFL